MSFMIMVPLIMGIVFFLDMLWLGIIAKSIYASHLGSLLRYSSEGMAPLWPAAILVYVFIALGIYFFVLPKTQTDYSAALVWGSLFGFVCYGIYDFTNYALLNNWPLTITLIDFIWGGVLCAVSSVIALVLQNRFL